MSETLPFIVLFYVHIRAVGVRRVVGLSFIRFVYPSIGTVFAGLFCIAI